MHSKLVTAMFANQLSYFIARCKDVCGHHKIRDITVKCAGLNVWSPSVDINLAKNTNVCFECVTRYAIS